MSWGWTETRGVKQRICQALLCAVGDQAAPVHSQLSWGLGLCGTDVDTGKAEPGQRQLPAAVVFMEFDIQVEIARVEEEKCSKVHRVFGWLYLARRIQKSVQINHQQSKLIAVCNSLAPSKGLRVLQIHIFTMLSYKKVNLSSPS